MPGKAEENDVYIQTGYPPTFGNLEVIVHCQFQVKMYVNLEMMAVRLMLLSLE
jgi:hypothetical protein